MPMTPKETTRKFETNAKVLKLMKLAGERGMSRQQVTDELGISGSHLSRLIADKDPTSRVIDRACEGLIRRLGKEPQDGKVGGTRLIVARVAESHWPTVSMLVTGLQGSVVDEFQALVTGVKDAVDKVVVVILTLDAQHEPAVIQLIRSTGGEVRKVLP